MKDVAHCIADFFEKDAIKEADDELEEFDKYAAHLKMRIIKDKPNFEKRFVQGYLNLIEILSRP